MEKRCSKCGEVKDVGEFSKDKQKKDGLVCSCKKCNQRYSIDNADRIKKTHHEYQQKNKVKLKEKAIIYRGKHEKRIKGGKKIYYKKNREKILIKVKEYEKINREYLLEKNKEWRKKNKEYIASCSKVYREEHTEELKEYREKNKEKFLLANRKYHKLNKRDRRVYTRNRYATNLNVKLASRLRGRFNIALKNNIKHSSAIKLLGCTIEELKQHMANQFTEGMTWDNWSLHGWHIDHIKPCASFDLTDPEQQKKCFHYTNLQPLWAVDNLSKGAKYEGQYGY